MDGLVERRHEVIILTTKPGEPIGEDRTVTHYPIFRVLHDRYGVRSFPKEVSRDILDVKRISGIVIRFQPDVIYLGHIYPLTKQLFPYLSTFHIPIISDEGGNSLKGAWTEHGRWFRFTGDYRTRIKWMNRLKPLVVSMVRFLSRGRIGKDWYWPEKLAVIFNSKKNRDFVLGLGVPIKRSEVLYSGIDAETFTFRLREVLSTPIKIICPGRIEPRKGQLDAVPLVEALRVEGIVAELVLVGKVFSEEYEQKIHEETERCDLDKQIQILPMISQDELVKLYHQADFCFFPSYQESGLSRIPLEAMACGSVVISYGNEGSDEIIKNDRNGYCVEPGDIKQIKEIIRILEASPAKVREICTNARTAIIETYALPAYIDKIEEFIKQSI